ncbi:carbohydrate porin (plasmid) [Ralstonia solanacearum]|uniref:carbohydrate porin n=1 Tax=Ralstonia solanacearum TaxID=305 RepID=UPI0006DD133B|nr:carbohydrate porin [Ralstonia solanacearum]QHB56424.1 carbohydrate porin [Ralstonia solanacearum]
MLFFSMLQYVWVAVRPLVWVRLQARRHAMLVALVGLLAVFTQGARAEDVPATDALPIAGGELDDRFGFHGQTTWVWQRKSAFNAPYSGDNSLSPERAKSYSFSATLDLGMRLWKGAEVHLNPEVAMGDAFSDLHGLGGPTNGELAKVTGSDPTLYRARAFLRQTWGLGGETEKIDADFNQFADVVDKRRIVLTAGNVPVLDIFDAVEYAHDPRTQFLNWSFMTHPSFDYPADARGYDWGVALEYIDSENGWAARAGRFLLPIESNGLALDTRLLMHYGDMLELEKRYALFGQEGKVRLLGWRNRARMGSFQDAIALGQATGTAPDVGQVRKEHAKVGVGLSFEQKLGENLGLFTRLNWSDDRTETYAFTEAGRNVSFGGLLKGTAWGRPNDVLGAAFSLNMLGPDHRAYLAAGGSGAFLGDGALNYAHERVLELFYSMQLVKGVTLSPDVQLIQNPGYNRDRGPAKFVGLRVHAEF